MLKTLGFILKMSLFALLILILGSAVHWDGKSLSNRIQNKLTSAQHFATETLGISSSAPRRPERSARSAPKYSAVKKAEDTATLDEDLPSSERQKLRALIRELNESRK